MAGAASDAGDAGNQGGQVADWSDAIDQPGGVSGCLLLAAAISRASDRSRTVPDAGEGFAAGVLRACVLCVCGAGAAVWRYSRAAWVSGVRDAGADIYGAVSGGGARGEV